MKNLFLFATLLILQSAIIQAAPVGSGFNYQGELTDSGSPANGNYDILFKAFTLDTGGTEYAVVPAFSSVVVTNGLFSIDNVDFGDALYDGTEYWIEVSVRQTGTGAYFALSPRQRLSATPYAVQADFLAANGANTGDYLKFNGSDWVGSALNIEPTPFTLTGDDLSYVDGRIGIGTHNPSAVLHVKGTAFNPVIVEGGDNMYMLFRENEVSRGYIGSYQTQTNTNDEDFEIGTVNGSTGNMHIVTGFNTPRITVTADGKVGINNLIPNQDFVVNGTTDGDVLRVNVDGDSKLLVDDNGGVGIGSLSTPPVNGLDVEGDVKQPINSNGIIKAMVHASCSTPGSTLFTTEIIKYYNAVNSGAITISETGNFGECILTFPFNISDRYFHVSPVGDIQTVANQNGNASICRVIDSTHLSCYKFNTENGEGLLSDYMLFIY